MSQHSNISQGGRKEEKHTNSKELRKTASGSWGNIVNLTSLIRFFVALLTQYSTSNVVVWYWLLPLKTANCSIVEKKSILPDGKIFANSFCICNYWKILNFFSSDEVHFELKGRVNKRNIYYCLADNPNRQVTKSLHSEWDIMWCAVSQYRIIKPFFFEDKNECTVSINSMWYEEKTFFFGIEEMLSCSKTNLVWIG